GWGHWRERLYDSDKGRRRQALGPAGIRLWTYEPPAGRIVSVVGDVEEQTDVALLREHLAGKAGAFETLVSRYSDELYGFLCRFVGNAVAAEDIIQDAFVQVHLAAETFDQQRSFKPWLYTIAANQARDSLRAPTRREAY